MIPQEWELPSLRELGQCFSGGTPRKSNSRLWGGDVPWVSSKDMKVSRIGDSIDHVTELAIGNGTRLVPSGAILMVVRGMSLVHSFPVAITTRPLTFNQDLKAFVPHSHVNGEFVLRWLQANQSRILLLATEATHGTKRLPTNDLLSSRVCLPDPAEQRAIAAALSDVDELIGALDKLIAKKRAIKHAAMQQLLTGKSRLVCGGDNRFKESDVGRFPCDWDVEFIGSLFETSAGGDFNKSRSQSTWDEEHPFPIYSNAISNCGLHGFCSYSDHPADSITVTARGTLGVANYRDHSYTAIGRVIVLQPKVKMDGRFFSAFINERLVLAIESTGVPQLTAPQFTKYKLPVPPPKEQRAIAKVLEDMDSEIAALEKRRDKTKSIKQGMMQSLLTGRVRLVEPEAAP